jgi:YbbR domain-containing protein
VERIKEGDIRAEVDFRGVVADEQKPQSLKVKCFVNGLTTSAQKELTMEPSPQRIRALVYLPITRRFAVIPVYPKELPAGLRYEKPILRPEMVRVIGRPDRVNRVERIVLIAEAIENGARIEGDYTPQARDKYDNPVEGVTLSPTTVHLAIPVAEEPLVKVVNISPDISDLPLPPHTLTEVRATPRSVRIMGRPERLAQISTIETETIAVGDFTETQEIVANLIIPPDIQVLDTANRPIKQVKIRIGIRKPTATATPPVTNPGNAPPPPNENKTEGVRPGSS